MGLLVRRSRAGSRGIGLPVLVRPSYVLGGCATVIAYDVNTVQNTSRAALKGPAWPGSLIVFIATEVDVTLADGTDAVIGGITEHIEEAGVHSAIVLRVASGEFVAGDTDTIREYI
jgi:carbamoyl-phosphate synthase large subunit